MGDWIEWDVPQPAVRERLVVERESVRRGATLDDLRKACEAVGLHVVDRGVFDAIVAKGALTRTEGRASDGDLQVMAENGYRLRSREEASFDDMCKLALAVAARVRRERPACLVERLVAGGYDFEVEEEGGGYWTVVTRTGEGPGPYRTTATDVPAADVPATLARLAGLDGGR